MTHEKNMMDYMKYVASEMPIIPIRRGFTEMEVQFLICNEQSIFLDSAPKLGDFVATNEDGEVMEQPHPSKNVPSNFIGDWKEWDKALDRVIWKDWEVDWQNSTRARVIHKNGAFVEFDKYDTSPTYNDLITSGVKLERIQKK